MCYIFDSVINASILHECLHGQLNSASGAQENGEVVDQEVSTPLLAPEVWICSKPGLCSHAEPPLVWQLKHWILSWPLQLCSAPVAPWIEIF